jgi:hypothetical protein
MRTMTSPTMIRPHVVFTDGRQKRQIQPYYDRMFCVLTDDINDKYYVVVLWLVLLLLSFVIKHNM